MDSELPNTKTRPIGQKFHALVRLVPSGSYQGAPQIDSALNELRLPIIGLVTRPALGRPGDCYFVQVESVESNNVNVYWRKDVLTALDRASAMGFECQLLGTW